MLEAVMMLLVFGLGYALGRRIGTKQGQHLGFWQAVIDLRIHALEEGICPICNYGAKTVKNDQDVV